MIKSATSGPDSQSVPATCPSGGAAADSHGLSRTTSQQTRRSASAQVAARQRHRLPKLVLQPVTGERRRCASRALLEAARWRAATDAGQSHRDLALVTLLAHNGLRIGEALAADVEDLGTERGHRILHVTRKDSRRGDRGARPGYGSSAG
jgi:integrase